MTGDSISAILPLGVRVVGAARWVLIGSVASNVLRLLSNLLLTRLLAPEMFGLIAVVILAGTIMTMTSDIGLQQTIIRSPRGDDVTYLDTVWTIQVCRGLLLWMTAIVVGLVLYAAGNVGFLPTGTAYADPKLPWLIAVAGCSAVFSGFQSTKAATANRHLNLRPLFQMELAVQVISLAITIPLAWATKSIWALVTGLILAPFLQTVFSHLLLFGPRNMLRWDQRSARDIWASGKWLLASSAVTVLAMNGDRLMLAGIVDARQLGLYAIAFGLASSVDGIFATIIGKLVLPAVSEVARNQPERLREVYLKIRWRMEPAMIISSGALYAAAPLLIDTLYDDRYSDASQILSILALGMLFSRYLITQQIYLAINKLRYQLVLNIIRLVSIYLFISVGYVLFEFTGALFAIALRDSLSLLLMFWFNSRHRLNDFRLELKLILLWPIGYLAGASLLWIVVNLREF